MSVNPQLDGIVALPVAEPAEPTNGHRVELAVAQPEAPTSAAATPRRVKPAWIGSLAVGVVALIASATLGFLTYSTAQERNATGAELAATRSDLKDTASKLQVANDEAATRLIVAKYVALYTHDQGKVHWDYQNFMRCHTFGACRTASQNLLNDLAHFQADRKGASVPADLVGADRDLGDALSSAYAATSQIVSAMDNLNISRFKAGISKLQAAMLSLGKVETAIGGELNTL